MLAPTPPRRLTPVPDPIRAGDPPTPLPSEVLAGQNIAGFVLTPTDLDRLPVLTTYPPDPPGDAHAACRAIQAGERKAAEEHVRRLQSALRAADARIVEVREAAEAQADALRAELARLTDLADDKREWQQRLRRQIDETARVARERDAAREEVVSLGRQLDACREQQGRQAATITNQRTPAVDDDPYRPHPDSWPDDAVLLRYRELRALVALHLDRYCEPGSGRAMRDGDVPLRLAEVLDQ
jgi:hypothetical protein